MMNQCVAVVLLLAFGATNAISLQQGNDVVVCPVVKGVDANTRIQSRDSVKHFRELSGLAFSPTLKAPSGKPILYGTNDGGGFERLGVWDSGTGDLLRTLVLPNKTFHNQDWESLSIGSCGTTGENETCLYIADVGDNWGRESNGKRSTRNFNFNVTYRILKMPEPNYLDYSNNEMLPENLMSVLPYNYFHESSPTKYADCEGMFLDHTGWGEGGSIGDLYLVTKWGAVASLKRQRVFKIPASAWPSTYGTIAPEYSPPAVGDYANGGDLMGNFWTRAESTFDGTLIAIGNLTDTYLFLRCPGQSVEEVLAPAGRGAKNCLRFKAASEGQVETIAWTPDGMKALVIPEGGNRPMGYTTMNYDVSRSKQVCPTLEWVNGKCQSVEDGTVYPNARCEALVATTNAPMSTPAPSSLPPTAIPATPAPTTEPPSLGPETASPTSAPSFEATASNNGETVAPSSFANRKSHVSRVVFSAALGVVVLLLW